MRRLPLDKTGALVGRRVAVFGTAPPKGFADAGVNMRDGLRMQPRRG